MKGRTGECSTVLCRLHETGGANRRTGIGEFDAEICVFKLFRKRLATTPRHFRRFAQRLQTARSCMGHRRDAGESRTHKTSSGKDSMTPLPRPSSPYMGVGDAFIPLPPRLLSLLLSLAARRGTPLLCFMTPRSHKLTHTHRRQHVVRIVYKIKACFVHKIKPLLLRVYVPICTSSFLPVFQ